MKKLLAVLSTLALGTTASMSVVACGDTNNQKEKADFSKEKFVETFKEYTYDEKEHKTLEYNVAFKEDLTKLAVREELSAQINKILNEKFKGYKAENYVIKVAGWFISDEQIKDGAQWTSFPKGEDVTSTTLLLKELVKDDKGEVTEEKELARVENFAVKVTIGKEGETPVDPTDPDDKDAKIKELEEKIATLENDLAEANKNLNEANANLEKANGNIADLEEQLGQAKQEVADAIKSKEEAESKVADLENQIKELEKDVTKNANELKLAKALLEVVRNGLLDANKKIDELTKELGDLPIKYQNALEDIKRLEQQRDEWMGVVADLKNQVNEKQDEINRLTQENDHLLVNLAGTLFFDKLNLETINIHNINEANQLREEVVKELTTIFENNKKDELLKGFRLDGLKLDIKTITGITNKHSVSIQYIVKVGDFTFERTQTLQVKESTFLSSDKRLARENAVKNLNLTGDEGKGKDISIMGSTTPDEFFNQYNNNMGVPVSISLFFNEYYKALKDIKGDVLTNEEKQEARTDIREYVKNEVSLVYLGDTNKDGSRTVLATVDKNSTLTLDRIYNGLHEKHGANDKEFHQTLALKFGGVTAIGSYWTFTFKA